MTMSSGPTGRLLQLLGFSFAAVAVVVYLLSQTHLRVPLLNDAGDYTVVAMINDVDNLAPAGQVRIAGVRVGQVRSVDTDGDRATVVLSISDDHAPLRDGVTVRVGARSLVEEGYLDVVDGDGAEIPSGTTLPEDAVRPSVQLRDVLHSLDKDTRAAMRGLLHSLEDGTVGTGDDLRSTVAGLGTLGKEGHTALDALAAQSAALEELTRQTTTVLAALDTGEGQIADMVSNANTLTAATSGQRDAIEKTMRQLPGVLASATEATGDLGALADTLAPVATDLRRAAPDLTRALRQLPDTSKDLRGLLPALAGVLDRAPATLERVPTLSGDVRALVPEAIATLRDVNPMLAYLKPYGPDIAAYVATFGAAMHYTDEVGHNYARLMPIYNDQSFQSPIDPGPIGAYKNPYPAPGQGGKPGPFTGEYPRVEEAPR